MKDNLYIIGYPRSMSTVVYYVTAHSLNSVYNGVDGGEYTNPDRVFKPITQLHEDINNKLKTGGLFWSNKNYDLVMDLYDNLHELNKTVVVKEVVYPHILSDFVQRVKAKTILIEKDIPLTAYSLIKNGWFYPTRLLYKEDPKGSDRIIALLKSLQFVWVNHFNVLKHKDYVETITAKEMMFNKQTVFDKLEKLGFKPKRFDYINDVFLRRYQEVEDYKKTELYGQIVKIWDDIK